MSILRIGLAEDDEFADGYARIFGKKKPPEAEKPAAEKPAEAAASESKPEAKPEPEKKS